LRIDGTSLDPVVDTDITAVDVVKEDAVTVDLDETEVANILTVDVVGLPSGSVILPRLTTPGLETTDVGVELPFGFDDDKFAVLARCWFKEPVNLI